MPFIPFGQIGSPLRGGIENISASRLTGGVINSQQIIIAGGTQGILRSENYNQDDKGWAFFGDGSSRMPGGFQVGNGTAAAPSMSFMSDTGLGLYRIAANSLGVAVGGAGRVEFTLANLRSVNSDLGNFDIKIDAEGTANSPTYNFRGDTDTGWYRIGVNHMGIAVGTELAIDISQARTVIVNTLNLGAAPELTVASGEITITGSYHSVDTQNDDATDNLDTINGGAEGDLLILRSVNNGRDTTLTDNSSSGGNLFLKGALNFALNSNRTTITLLFSGSNWLEVVRSVN